MNPKDLAQVLQGYSLEELKEFAHSASSSFDAKAHALYEQDPDNNGSAAQPYIDASSMFQALEIMLEEELQEDIDSEDPIDDTEVEAPQSRANPWGKRG